MHPAVQEPPYGQGRLTSHCSPRSNRPLPQRSEAEEAGGAGAAYGATGVPGPGAGIGGEMQKQDVLQKPSPGQGRFMSHCSPASSRPLPHTTSACALAEDPTETANCVEEERDEPGRQRQVRTVQMASPWQGTLRSHSSPGSKTPLPHHAGVCGVQRQRLHVPCSGQRSNVSHCSPASSIPLPHRGGY